MTDFPKWLYVLGGLGIVAVSAWSGSRWGAWMVVLIVLSMLAYAQTQGKINYGT